MAKMVKVERIGDNVIWAFRLRKRGQVGQLSKRQPLEIVMDLEEMPMVSSSEFTNLVKGLSREVVIG